MKLLLETTIQLHRVADDFEIKSKINHECLDKRIFTTTYVLRELLRTIIKDIGYIHAAASEIKIEDGSIALGVLARALAHGKFNYSTRAARREQYVVAAILDCFDSTRLPLQKLLTFLEMTAQQWLEDFFEVPGDTGEYRKIQDEDLLNGIDSPPDEMRRWISTGRPIPGPPPFPSGAARFLQERGALISQIEACIMVAPSKKRDTKTLAFLARMKRANGEFDFAGRLTSKTRGCWCLGDTIIALESPIDALIYTTDKHYDIICEGLGVSRYTGYMPGR